MSRYEKVAQVFKMQGVGFTDFVAAESKGVRRKEQRFHGGMQYEKY
jgi:hypothetical protein